MTIATIVMYACHRLRQPSIIGYLFAGLIIGPYTPPFSLVTDIASIRSISELGLVFLMFSLGLEFNLPRLRKAGMPAAITAIIVVGGMLLTGLLAGKLLGWSLPSSLLLGAILSISGSTIIAKVFFDLKVTQETFARAVFGLMICDDIIAMIILSVVSGFSAQSASLASATTLTFIKIIFFILLFLTLGLMLVPKILDAVANLRNRELTGISALGLCFAGAFIAAHFNFSIALGTFLMGAIVAASPHRDEIDNWTTPLQDMFSALFFVAAGMLVDPRSVISNWLPVTLILFITIIGRSFWGIIASVIAGYDLRMAIKVGLSSAQIGEFSFILAAAGAAGGLTQEWLYGIMVATAMLTTFIFPYLMRNMSAIEDSLFKYAPAGLIGLCNRYHAFFLKAYTNSSASDSAGIFSKYALRLTIYITLATGVMYFGGAIADIPIIRQNYVSIFIVWICAAIGIIPTAIAIARYFSHIILLLVTMTVTRFALKLIQRLNIRMTYTIANALSLSILGWTFLLYISYWLNTEMVFYLGAGLLLCAILARKQLLIAMDLLEKMLDLIIGLATSEPVHQIAVAT
ncbi:MAG: cation:proton antiporter, partial [Elusimicrobiaceae bacterium]|nr:cation:proton antiporter [Elusimicrobiaceae bacterium]